MNNYGTNIKKRKITPFVVMSVIEKNNIMRIVITIDIVERSPTPIVIYSVKGELDYLATKDENR